MNFAQPLLEVAGLIVSLALVGLILSRSTETATVVSSTASSFGSLIRAATAGAGAPVQSSYSRRGWQ